MVVVQSMVDLIGDTPMIDVSQLSPNPNVRILAKLENHNPTGSVKDRIALAMVNAAEATGELVPGRIVIEPSSGNTGIALAMICSQRGYRLKIVLPESVTEERRQILEAFGAEIIPSPGGEGSNGAVRLAQRLSEENPSWVFLYQYGNEANPLAHYEGTGPEILADAPDITHFVAGLGTSGTLMGVGSYLKEKRPQIKLYAVEPPSGETVEGLRSLDDGYVPPIFDKWGGVGLLDGKRIVRPAESIYWARRMMLETGVLAGISAGAALAGAVKVAERLGAKLTNADKSQPDGPYAATIVFLVSDGAWKYLSAGVYGSELGKSDVAAAAEKLDELIYF